MPPPEADPPLNPITATRPHKWLARAIKKVYETAGADSNLALPFKSHLQAQNLAADLMHAFKGIRQKRIREKGLRPPR